MRRYSFPCRICDGDGFHRYVDRETGNNVLDACQCGRGTFTILLAPEDERALFNQLKLNLNE